PLWFTVLAVPGTKITATALPETAWAQGGWRPQRERRGGPRGDERRSGRNSTLELSDDRDRTADRQTEIAVCASLVDRDFGKPVRVLVREARAERPIAEGPRALEHAARRGELGVGRQHRRPQAGHGIAEVINVDDFGEVVRPVRSAVRVILARPAWRRLAARQHGCDRREQVAAMEARRQALRLKVDVPAARVCGAALDQLEQAVARADVPAAVGLD